MLNYIQNDLKGNENWFELVGGSSYRGFELPRVKLQLMYCSDCTPLRKVMYQSRAKLLLLLD